jgi:hypothetical protein
LIVDSQPNNPHRKGVGLGKVASPAECHPPRGL